MEDQQLLREYVASNSDEAFTELVRLHLGLVYSAVFRKVGDRSAAEDVTQTVFTLLAQKARSLESGHFDGLVVLDRMFQGGAAPTSRVPPSPTRTGSRRHAGFVGSLLATDEKFARVFDSAR